MTDESRIVAAYADGGVIKVNPSPYGGTWAICFVDAEGNRVREHSGILRPEEGVDGFVTNNVTELYALVRAILNLPAGWSGTIYSDSKVSLLRVFRNAKLNGVPDWLAEATGKARAHLRLFTSFQWRLLDGHPTRAQLEAGKGKRGNMCSEHNVFCDAECGRQAKAFLSSQAALPTAGTEG